MLTQNDIMEELSRVYVRAVASRAGFAVEEVRRDRDSVDLQIGARGVLAGGDLHSPVLAVQLKSTTLDLVDGSSNFPFDLKIKNYHDLIRTTLIPCVLVVFLLPAVPARWTSWSEEALILRRSAYWRSLRGLPATDNTSSVRVQVARSQIFDGEAIQNLLARISRREVLSHE